MAFKTQDELNKEATAKHMLEEAAISKRLAQQKWEESPQYKAQKEAEERRTEELLLLPFAFAGALGATTMAGASTTQGDPNDPSGGNMITDFGNQLASMLGMGSPQPQPGVAPPKSTFSIV